MHIDAVELLLKNHITRKEEYTKLYTELMSVPPLGDGCKNYLMGIKLWLLTSPSRSWEELAWGLYRSHLDRALEEIKRQHIVLAPGNIF